MPLTATVMDGMGAIALDNSTAFRVWAPHAEAVSVIGSFNNWSPQQDRMEQEGNGYWYTEVENAGPGAEYKFWIRNGEQVLQRVDPYARQVTNSVGNAVVPEPNFDWGGDSFELPPLNELVIYELHVGTFNLDSHQLPGVFADVVKRFDHLRKLGINVIELMPVAEFAGDISWGYNPAHIFAVESAYGGPAAFKQFVKLAHEAGFGVVLDVVYNHFGPSDLSIWHFDGWSENGGGGIYFYNDWRSKTPWGDTRPDYGRPEVRQFIRDNAMMWVEDYHVDGLRMDMTLYVRQVEANNPATELADGWSLIQWVNKEIHSRYPRKITIAEDLQDNEWLTKRDGAGAGFSAQWCASFVHPVRAAVTAAADESRSMGALSDALTHTFNGDGFQRVLYSESHDEVANGQARVPYEIDPTDGHANWFAEKRSTQAAALVFTAPGIPMLFQGQEFLQGGWFQDTVPLDWGLTDEYHGLLALYRDLIALRRNLGGKTRGLTGSGIRIQQADEKRKLLAFHRWYDGGPGDDVIVIGNFSAAAIEGCRIAFPADGLWKVRLNSDWSGYSPDFGGAPAPDLNVTAGEATLNVPAYSVLIFSQD